MKINFAWQQKLLVATLVILVCTGSYFTLAAFAFIGGDAPLGQHLDRTPGVHYLKLATADWLIVIVLIYWLLKHAKEAAIQKLQSMRNPASQDTEKVWPPPPNTN